MRHIHQPQNRNNPVNYKCFLLQTMIDYQELLPLILVVLRQIFYPFQKLKTTFQNHQLREVDGNKIEVFDN